MAGRASGAGGEGREREMLEDLGGAERDDSRVERVVGGDVERTIERASVGGKEGGKRALWGRWRGTIECRFLGGGWIGGGKG